MSQENVEVVRAIYEEWRRGNFRAGVRLYDPFALLVQSAEFPESGAYLGTQAIREHMRTFLEAWSRVTIGQRRSQRPEIAWWRLWSSAGPDREVARFLPSSATSTSGRSVAAGSSGLRSSETEPRPSKPWGYGSRRCRRRTSDGRMRRPTPSTACRLVRMANSGHGLFRFEGVVAVDRLRPAQ
jgi:hypothetical protein